MRSEKTYDVTLLTTFVARFSLGFHSAITGDMALGTTYKTIIIKQEGNIWEG